LGRIETAFCQIFWPRTIFCPVYLKWLENSHYSGSWKMLDAWRAQMVDYLSIVSSELNCQNHVVRFVAREMIDAAPLSSQQDAFACALHI
jgi:hypothetical protein